MEGAEAERSVKKKEKESFFFSSCFHGKNYHNVIPLLQNQVLISHGTLGKRAKGAIAAAV